MPEMNAEGNVPNHEVFATDGRETIDVQTLAAYQVYASDYAIFPAQPTVDAGERAVTLYPFVGLASEAGELMGKVKKLMRDGPSPALGSREVADELGDVLWYVSACADALGLNLRDIAVGNLNKLADRKARGKLQGSGDKR